MDQIATETQAYNIGGSGSAVTNKMCTHARALELGCQDSAGYATNRLVRTSNLSFRPYLVVGSLMTLTAGSNVVNSNVTASWYTAKNTANQLYYSNGTLYTNGMTLTWYNNGTQVYPTAIGNTGTATVVMFKFPTLSKGVYTLNVTTTSGLSQTVSGTVS